MDLELVGKKAVITGGSRGIGKSIAMSLAKEGVEVSICSRSMEALKSAAREIELETSQKVFFSEADTTSMESVNDFIEFSASSLGGIDILVNNAGVAPVVRWPDVTEENWRDVLDINLNGAFHCLLHVMEHMKSQRWGRVINISSVGAFKGSITAHPAYGVSKAGLIAMTKSAAKELAEFGILVNSVSPGTIDTPLTQNNFTPEEQAMFVEDSVLKRRGSPFEIADAVLFLASERSTYITGATIHVNGGSLLV